MATLERQVKALEGEIRPRSTDAEIERLERRTEKTLAQIPGLSEAQKTEIVKEAVLMAPLPDGTLDLFRAHRSLARRWGSSWEALSDDEGRR